MAASAGLGLILSLVTAVVLGPTAALPAAIAFTVVSCLIVGVELRHHRPARGVLLMAIVVVATAEVIGAAMTDEPVRVAGALLGGAAAFLALFAVHVASPNSMTTDDVAYAALIGTTLGWFGIGRVGLGLGLGLIIGAVAAGPQVLVSRRRAESGLIHSKTAVSFAPALGAGGWIALCWGDSIVRWYGQTPG